MFSSQLPRKAGEGKSPSHNFVAPSVVGSVRKIQCQSSVCVLTERHLTFSLLKKTKYVRLSKLFEDWFILKEPLKQ